MIRGAVLHDGTGSPPVADAVFVAVDGMVTYAGPAVDAPDVAGSTVIDAEGRHLIPGLIDCHVHLGLDGGPDFMVEADCEERDAVERSTRNAARHLAAGVTTVRDLGGIGMSSIRVARAQAAGEISGPRIITAGQVLTRTGGHAHVIGRQVDTTEQLISAIKDLHRRGATCIKIIATGGVLTPGVNAQLCAFDAETLEPAVAFAHSLGLAVAAHATGAEGIETSLRAGVDSIEHGSFLSDEAIALLAVGTTALVPTLSAPIKINSGGTAIPPETLAKSNEVGAAHTKSFARAVEAGAWIAAGTDAGTPFNYHGAFADELAFMHDYGLPLDRVLVAATRDAARLLRLEDCGTLAIGARADAVLLDGDPLAEVSAYGRVRAVVQAGIQTKTGP